MAGINRTTGKATDLITFSRASGGTALRKISYGSELVTNGDFSYDGDWTLTNGSITGGEYVGPASGAQGVQQTSATPLGTKLYLVQFDAYVESSVTTVYLRLGTLANSASWTIGTASKTYTTVIAAGGVNDLIYLLAGSAVNLHLDNISVKEVLFDQPDGTLTLFNHPNNIPRIEYAADGTVKGLLIEEQRTNFVLYSDVNTTNWVVASGITASSQVVSNPLGLSSVVKVVPTTASIGDAVTRTVNRFINVTPGAIYTYSAFVKADGYDAAYIIFTDRPNVYGGVAYDLSNGSLIETDGANIGVLSNPFIENYGDGWFRIGFTHNGAGAIDASNGVGIGFVPRGLSNTIDYSQTVFAGDGVSGGYVMGVQVEAGSFATSYMPSSGSPATRAADIASISVDNFGYRQDAGTVVVGYQKIQDDQASNSYAWSISQAGTYANRIIVGTGSGISKPISLSIVGNVVQFSDQFTTGVSGLGYHAFAFKENDFAHTLDGATPETGSSGTLPTIIDNLYLGSSHSGERLNGYLKSISYYPRRLSNAQLVQLTA